MHAKWTEEVSALKSASSSSAQAKVDTVLESAFKLRVQQLEDEKKKLADESATRISELEAQVVAKNEEMEEKLAAKKKLADESATRISELEAQVVAKTEEMEEKLAAQAKSFEDKIEMITMKLEAKALAEAEARHAALIKHGQFRARVAHSISKWRERSENLERRLNAKKRILEKLFKEPQSVGPVVACCLRCSCNNLAGYVRRRSFFCWTSEGSSSVCSKMLLWPVCPPW